MDTSRIQTAIEVLLKSPLFNFSLASKELFHSNFLAWIFEQRDNSARNLLKKIAPEIGEPQFDDSFKIEREKNNFDIRVLVSNQKSQSFQIIIENKVKSIPHQKQLKNYSKKLSKDSIPTIAILLSLSKPVFFENKTTYVVANTKTEWKFIGYAELLDTLRTSRDENNFYHTALLKDYHDFIKNLVELHDVVHETFKTEPKSIINPFDWPNPKENSLYERFKTIRMHDIFEKWRMQAIEEKLKKSCDIDSIVFSTGFTRGLGLLDITVEGVGENHFFKKIQLQGTQLRQVLEKYGAKGKEVFNQATLLLKDSKWFRDSQGVTLPEQGKKENNYFCKYGNSFVYRYEKLNDLSRLIELIEKLK